eukprot:TRINITY_DN7210_c0_g1_i8.p5 TRINITY_DN7210_c0_g1~~TRINITY_DN7210_c0_g1_i8.p5  ORF type:complete len:100 (-),score=2.61 TRINITY_DN7210_c0_g1_i8:253-552(-)
MRQLCQVSEYNQCILGMAAPSSKFIERHLRRYPRKQLLVARIVAKRRRARSQPFGRVLVQLLTTKQQSSIMLASSSLRPVSLLLQPYYTVYDLESLNHF